MAELEIRRLAKEEISLAVEWAWMEGWNPGLHDSESFYSADSLLQACQQGVEGEQLLLDVPDDNSAAVQLAESVDSEIVFATNG